MTIKAKLIANVLFMTAIVVVISLASFFSMSFLQKKLLYLTEKSTPFQMRSIELQRELQGCIAILNRVNASRNMTEYTIFRTQALKTLSSVVNTQKILDKMGNETPGLSDILGKTAMELLASVEERIKSNDAATSANDKVLQSMKVSTARLNDLETSIRDLQVNYSRAFAAALENTGTFSGKLKSIEELRNLVRDLQLIAVSVQNMENASTVLIAGGKLKAVMGRVVKNDYYKANQSIASVATGFADILAEYIKLQSLVIAQKNEDSKRKAAVSGKDILYKLNDLFQTLDQETMLVRDELALANGRQGVIFAQSRSANGILVSNSELVVLGLRAAEQTNRLFTLDSLAELNKLDSEIRDLFTKINERVQILESSLTKLNAGKELRMLLDAVASVAVIRNEIYSSNGIVTTLKKKLNAIEQANRSADKLRDIVIQQTAMGNKNVSVARGEQEKSISAVNSMVSRSLSQILGIGSMAIVIGICFGFWIYRSVVLPLRVILDAVRRQEEQGREKASLAEAIAGGDLSREVTVSKAITPEMKRDELGMVLNAVAGMSEAQVTLDRALAGMTASLRSSRDEEARRDHLKSGLFELSKILRIEHNTAELADEALAFMADFLGAGVGIIYLYDNKEEMLQTLSTYAISRSGRLNEGFRLGEGLAGQVAQERKMICLDSVPPDYLPITSALGKADPLIVSIMPIMHNKTLVGVLELGSFRRFGDDDFDFLNQSLEGIAIAISVNRSRQLLDQI